MSSGPTPKASLKDWFLLTRPWSVTAPLVPFLVGVGFGSQGTDNPFAWLRWALGLVSGILLVLACNLFNTWGDERSGVDRVKGAFLTTPQIQQGKITLRQTFIFGCVLFVLAGLCGLPTLFEFLPDHSPFCFSPEKWMNGDFLFNWPLFVAALIGFAGAVNYSTGIKYKYLGLGVPIVALLEGTLYIFVVIFLLNPPFGRDLLVELFGIGSDVQNPLSLFGAVIVLFLTLPVASLVGVILHGNDMRDIVTDRAAGTRTLASWLGPFKALVLFYIMHLIPYFVLGLIALLALVAGVGAKGLGFMLPFLALPLTIRLLAHALRDYRANPAAPAWLDLEQGSGAIHFVFGILYALALALCE